MVWGLGAAAAGSFWYARNLVATGNPLPWIGFRLGPLTLHSIPPPADCGDTTLADYAGRLGAARDDIVPQLSAALGPAWPLVLGMAAAGIVAGVVQRRARLPLVLALVAVVATIAYVFTPGSAGGAAAKCFASNTRFVAQALAIGAAVLPMALAHTGVRQRWLVAAIALAVLLNIPSEASATARVGVSAVAALAVVTALRLGRQRPIPRRWRPGPRVRGGPCRGRRLGSARGLPSRPLRARRPYGTDCRELCAAARPRRRANRGRRFSRPLSALRPRPGQHRGAPGRTDSSPLPAHPILCRVARRS
jgi:hypothetical protein